MGHLIKGKWKSGDVITSNDAGEFDREKSVFREWISKDHPTYKPEKNRYHLYVSYACPWAHRTLITRKLKKLEDIISISVVHPHMLEHSWSFDSSFEGATEDTVNHKKHLYEVYLIHDPLLTSKVTVPVLWDKVTHTIVNNESSEIIRMLNSEFNEFGNDDLDLYPEHLKDEIESWNSRIYEPINNGVYRTGFAKNQEAYERAFNELFTALDQLEVYLENCEYLVSNQLTEADVRLITTLLRFDAVYYGHFKCNQKKISEYPNLFKYTKNLYQLDAIKETTNIRHIKEHYYYSHDFINPTRIVPIGPDSLF